MEEWECSGPDQVYRRTWICNESFFYIFNFYILSTFLKIFNVHFKFHQEKFEEHF